MTSDGVHIAYQTVGEGPGDLVFAPGFVFNVEQTWQWPQLARFASRLSGFARLIHFDRRGTGLSDHIVPHEALLTLEARMDDIRAVMDEAGSERAALFGFEEGFALCAMFAATYPDRVSALVAQAPTGLGLRDAERPWAFSQQVWDDYLEDVRLGLGNARIRRIRGEVRMGGHRRRHRVVPAVRHRDDGYPADHRLALDHAETLDMRQSVEGLEARGFAGYGSAPTAHGRVAPVTLALTLMVRASTAALQGV
jgi:pimeloyl-ACP methyl ester carboxylesterase